MNEIFGENVLMTHILYLAKGNGDVLYHLPEKQFVPDENHVKWSIFSSTCNCGQMVQKFPGILVKARKREYLQRYYLFSPKHSTKMNRSINFKISKEIPKIPFKWSVLKYRQLFLNQNSPSLINYEQAVQLQTRSFVKINLELKWKRRKSQWKLDEGLAHSITKILTQARERLHD